MNNKNNEDISVINFNETSDIKDETFAINFKDECKKSKVIKKTL